VLVGSGALKYVNKFMSDSIWQSFKVHRSRTSTCVVFVLYHVHQKCKVLYVLPTIVQGFFWFCNSYANVIPSKVYQNIIDQPSGKMSNYLPKCPFRFGTQLSNNYFTFFKIHFSNKKNKKEYCLGT
jgi:hypothetical protein